jgi:hypothetical protein
VNADADAWRVEEVWAGCGWRFVGREPVDNVGRTIEFDRHLFSNRPVQDDSYTSTQIVFKPWMYGRERSSLAKKYKIFGLTICS